MCVCVHMQIKQISSQKIPRAHARTQIKTEMYTHLRIEIVLALFVHECQGSINFPYQTI